MSPQLPPHGNSTAAHTGSINIAQAAKTHVSSYVSAATEALEKAPISSLPKPLQHPTMTLLATLLLPSPLPYMISQRLDLITQLQTFQTDIKRGKKGLNSETFSDFETLRDKVLSVRHIRPFTRIPSPTVSQEPVLKDPTWGLDPEMGLVDEQEAVDYLVCELGDMQEGLVREVGQLVVLGMQWRKKKGFTGKKSVLSSVGASV
jgi:hypothetical protein